MNALLNTVTDAAWRMATTPTPSPTGVDANDVTPGVWGFAITFLVAAVVVLLIIDMQRRVRRVTYKADVTERLQEELAAQEAQQAQQAQQSEQNGAPAQPGSPARDGAPGQEGAPGQRGASDGSGLSDGDTPSR